MDSFNSHGQAPDQSAEGDVQEGPRRNRDSLFLLAQIRLGDSDRWSSVRVRNLSSGGLMAELNNPLPINTIVELKLRGIGAVSGRIAWQTEGRAGVAFDTTIDPLKARKPVGTGKQMSTYAAGHGTAGNTKR